MLATFTHLLGPRKGECERFESTRISIGRAPDNDLIFGDNERRVSSHHAEIIRRIDHYVLRDLGSTNGTMINGRRVITSEIRPDDLLEFGAGGPLLRFGIEPKSETGETQEPVSAPGSSNQSGQVEPVASRSVIEKLVNRAFRARLSNRRLIAAIVLAMILGAVAGILLSSRIRGANPVDLSFAEVAARNHSAVVFIRVEFELLDAAGQVVSSDARTGSGFVVSTKGLIVTNRHLIQDWEYSQPAVAYSGRTTKIEVVFPGQTREQAIPAALYRLSAFKQTDVAILKIEPPPGLRPVFGIESDLSHINQGEEVAVIGYPLGRDLMRLTGDERLETSLSTGVVSRVSQDFIQLYLRAYRGNSGGPVLNRRGRVIGILTSNIGSAEDIALATPIAAAMNLIKDEPAQ